MTCREITPEYYADLWPLSVKDHTTRVAAYLGKADMDGQSLAFLSDDELAAVSREMPLEVLTLIAHADFPVADFCAIYERLPDDVMRAVYGFTLDEFRDMPPDGQIAASLLCAGIDISAFAQLAPAEQTEIYGRIAAMKEPTPEIWRDVTGEDIPPLEIH